MTIRYMTLWQQWTSPFGVAAALFLGWLAAFHFAPEGDGWWRPVLTGSGVLIGLFLVAAAMVCRPWAWVHPGNKPHPPPPPEPGPASGMTTLKIPVGPKLLGMLLHAAARDETSLDAFVNDALIRAAAETLTPRPDPDAWRFKDGKVPYRHTPPPPKRLTDEST